MPQADEQKHIHNFFSDGYVFTKHKVFNSDGLSLLNYKIFRCSVCLEVRVEKVSEIGDADTVQGASPASDIERKAINKAEAKAEESRHRWDY